MRDVFKAQPDPWQDDVLQAFPHFPRQAMKASKGPGKTCTLAWLCWNFLLTRANANIAATSISGDNLRDGLWKEMAVWQNKSDLLQRVFKWGVERIEHKEKPATWFMSARSWAKAASDEALGNTLAGLHMDHMMFVIDEAGGVPVAILQAAEAGLANAIQGTGKEAHLVIAGNTNMLDGSLYQACVKQRTMWHVTNITGDPDDPKRSSRVSIDWARELIKANGRDNPFVKVMVLGEWPPSSVNSLIGPDEVEQAMKRCYREFQYNKFAKILGVDVALDLIGSDASVIFPRQGMVAFPPIVLRGADSIQGAGAVARKWEDWGADACFVDATGGFGAGWIDQLRMLGKVPIGVKYSGEAHEKGRYYNKRTEMYFVACQWVKEGGQLPECPELLAALPQTCYTFKGDRLLLEPKDVVKGKLGYSPDHADAFVQTFSDPVSPGRRTTQGERKPYDATGDYDTFGSIFEAMDK